LSDISTFFRRGDDVSENSWQLLLHKINATNTNPPVISSLLKGNSGSV
jgi:hypothetical protein